MRVLAVAYRSLDKSHEKYDAEITERDLTLAGLVAIIDPPREEVRKAFRNAQDRRHKTGHDHR